MSFNVLVELCNEDIETRIVIEFKKLDLVSEFKLVNGDLVEGIITDNKFKVIKILNRVKSEIVGILQLEDIKLHGHTKKGLPIYTFIPFSNSFPAKFYVASSSKVKKNIIATITLKDWSTLALWPTGTLIKTIGFADDINSYDIGLLHKNSLIHNLSFKSGSEAFECAPKGFEDALELIKNRPHYKDITVIDPSGSTDFDDGFHIDDDGSLYVHIADVDYYFPESSLYENILKKKITSVYSINKVYHLLPEKYASEIISLNKKGIKYTLTVVFSPLKQFLNVHLSTVTVKRNLSYEDAADQINTDDAILKLSKITEKTDTHKMIETIMIWTNSAIGKLLFENGLNFSVYYPKTDFQKTARALYSIDNTGHDIMKLEYYTHFTSPIRRYADLIAHRLVKQVLKGSVNTSEYVSREVIEQINSYTLKVKKYNSEKNILLLFQKLKDKRSVIKTPGKIVKLENFDLQVDSSDTDKAKLKDKVKAKLKAKVKAKVYLEEYNMFFICDLFSEKLDQTIQMSIDGENIIITSFEKVIIVPMEKSITFKIYTLESETRLHKKVKVSLDLQL